MARKPTSLNQFESFTGEEWTKLPQIMYTYSLFVFSKLRPHSKIQSEDSTWLSNDFLETLAHFEKAQFCSKVGKNKSKLRKSNPVVVVTGMTLVPFTQDQMVLWFEFWGLRFKWFYSLWSARNWFPCHKGLLARCGLNISIDGGNSADFNGAIISSNKPIQTK